MALTKAQELALYQILEVPYFATVTKLEAPDNILATEFEAGTSNRQAKALISAHLTTNIYTDADLEVELVTLLTRWIAIGTDMTTLDGGVGGISGVMDNPDNERGEIRRRVLVIVPFYRVHTSMERDNNGSGSSMFVPLNR